MTQHEITRPTDLLDRRGRVREPGWARRMHYRYDRAGVRANPFALKEWDFYQLRQGDWIVQLTIGHVSYAGSVSAIAFNLRTGQRAGFNHLLALPLRRWPMETSPDTDSVLARAGRGWSAEFTTASAGQRHLVARDERSRTDIDITLAADPADDRMVIATPFQRATRFYLNHKQNFWGGSGRVVLGDVAFDLDATTTATLDWGRGVWPYRQRWYWGNGTAFVDGHRFGFNIGWGFGDTSRATENMVFVDGTAVKLGEVHLDHDPADYLAPWRFSSGGDFEVTMTPLYDNVTGTRIPPVVDTSCHQVWGTWNGTVRTPEGGRLVIEDVIAFCEYAVNRW
jgi:hypothetical protein